LFHGLGGPCCSSKTTESRKPVRALARFCLRFARRGALYYRDFLRRRLHGQHELSWAEYFAGDFEADDAIKFAYLLLPLRS
jgi:hypothetical protein